MRPRRALGIPIHESGGYWPGWGGREGRASFVFRESRVFRMGLHFTGQRVGAEVVEIFFFLCCLLCSGSCTGCCSRWDIGIQWRHYQHLIERYSFCKSNLCTETRIDFNFVFHFKLFSFFFAFAFSKKKTSTGIDGRKMILSFSR